MEKDKDYTIKCKRCATMIKYPLEELRGYPADFCSEDCFTQHTEFQDYKQNKEKYNKF